MQSLRLWSLIVCCLTATCVLGQIDARLLRHPDVSTTHITFVYANDVWTVPKSGGLAIRLSSPAGAESFPRFSPDGSRIAFSGNYDGNTDIYIVPLTGGLPRRVTYHGMGDRLLDWYPDGEHLLFASSRHSGKQRFNQFYKISAESGLAEQLPVPYGEFASFSPDGQSLAYTTRTRLFRTWKRYRGGMAADIYTFNLNTLASEQLTEDVANDELPMWREGRIYFLSDRGAAQRFNLHVYDLSTKAVRQLTSFTDKDVEFPAMGPQDIVFGAGGRLYLFNLASEQLSEVPVQVISDLPLQAPELVNAAENIQDVSPSPSGKRLIVAARGELFNAPATEGFISNLTQTGGVAERSPAYSPDGREVAYWSDANGEYNLMVRELQTGKAERLTDFKDGFRYNIFWSPDGRKLAFVDQAMRIQYYDRDARKVVDVDKDFSLFEGELRGFQPAWSPDSRWLAYLRTVDNQNSAVFLYDTRGGQAKQVTAGFYSDGQVTFDPEGKYLFLTTNRDFSPIYSDMDNSWIYPNSTQIAAVPLTADTPSPLAAENDVEGEPDSTETAEAEKERKQTAALAKAKKETPRSKTPEVKVDLDNFERRLVVLPIKEGNFRRISAAKGKLVFQRTPRTGEADESPSPILYYDLDKREEKTIVPAADGYELTADGEHLLVAKDNKYYVIPLEPDQKLEKAAPTQDLPMQLDPRAEWRQIFNDVWRFERDYFYDKNMHGVDWITMRKQYGDLIEQAGSREDVNYIIGELIAELNASHTYRGGGDEEEAEQRKTGYLGVDWEIADGKYRIGHIIRGAPWDAEVRSPLDAAGIDLREGDAVLAVNGRPLDVKQEPYAAFEGLGGKTAQLTIERGGKTHRVVVELMEDETRLRNLAWIESNRRRVEEATAGRVGYVYVPSTGRDGQNELARMFYAQANKEGMIIDERFNNGGQIPDRFIELLDRPALAFWAVRDGRDWQWPPRAHFGPKVMLINGWSGSGGDAFPDYFRKADLGPLVGTRTWGGLIGVSGAPGLIDGGGVTVPTFRMYDPSGKWFREGHGVEPDIKVEDDPTTLAKGKDPQLEKAIEEVLRLLKEQPAPKPEHEAYEKRTAGGRE